MLARLAAIALILAFVSACSKDESPAATPAANTAPSVEPSPTDEPTKIPRPVTTYVPPLTATPAATPTAIAPRAAPGTETGIAEVDGVIRAVLNRDTAALAALMPLQSVACTNASGAGGPPKCPETATGYAPEGTAVQAFPVLQCEGFWVEETGTLIRELVRANPELYGVVQLRFATPLFGEPHLPRPDYGVILSVSNPPGAPLDRRGIMLMLEDGVVAVAYYLCTGPPEAFLRKQPQPYLTYGDHSLVILRGPAYRDP